MEKKREKAAALAAAAKSASASSSQRKKNNVALDEPKYDKDGKQKVTITDEDKNKMWRILAMGHGGGGPAIVKALNKEILVPRQLMAFIQLHEEYTTVLCKLVDTVLTEENTIDEFDLMPFLDYLMSLGQVHYDGLLKTPDDLLKKDDTTYYQPNGKPNRSRTNVRKYIQEFINEKRW